MEFLTVLWLPILLSAIFVFIVSSIMHMLLPIHKGDYKGLPGESELLAAMRKEGVLPGEYAFPRASSMKEMSTPEMVKKLNDGPVGYATIISNGPMKMGKSLGLWFLQSLIISIFVAYVANLVLPGGTHYMTVFRVAGTLGVMGYSLGHMHDAIWKGVSWKTTCKFMFDGVVYSLVMAGVFGWLWPV